MAEDQSPSSCSYCYQLECSIRIEPTSTENNKASMTAKNAIVTVGRNAQRQILIQIEIMNRSNRTGQPALGIYSLKDAIVHQQNVAKGRTSIEIPLKKLILQLSNCAPRKLNVFVKSLQAKLDIMKGEGTNLLRTPISVARNNLINGLPTIFNVLSPLSVGEIRKVRKMRGISTGESPLAKCNGDEEKTPTREREMTKNAKKSTATTPISNARDRRILASSIGLKRMRTFARFDDDDKSEQNFAFAPLKSIAEEEPEDNEKLLTNRVELSEEQKQVVRCVVKDRKNVFFTGSAGTGKSVVLRRIIELLPASTTFITAATGVAACQIGGVTLHSFAGIGVGEGDKEKCLNFALTQKNVIKQWKQCCHLIIDEISMIDRDFFTKLEYVARNIRNKETPFGGIQLIITGDFFQLPPVSKSDPMFCFESEAWNRCISKTIVLKTVKRQNDSDFVKILDNIRQGRCDTIAAKTLMATVENKFGDNVVPTRLCTHTADAVKINLHNLEKNQGEEKIFIAHDDGYISEKVQCLVDKKIVLKIGCQVMLIKNIDLSRGLSNGSRGCVTGFSANGNPLVHFVATRNTIEIKKSPFSVRIPGSDVSMTRTQIPLQLAWAISIHKSQGLTLDCVEMNLGRVFADGQAYVALSRARSLSSVRITGFEASCVRANSKVIEYYKYLNQNDENNEEEDYLISTKKSRLSI